MRKNGVMLTLGQIVAGSVVGVAGGWLCLLAFETFLWKFLLEDRVSHGFWVGIFLFISLSAIYGLVIIGAGMGIRFVSGRFGVDVPLKPLCSGAFLGPPAVVGLLSMLNVPWEIFGSPNLILALLLPLLKTITYLLSLPMRGWMSLGLPVEIWYILAIPIGAILGYRLTGIEGAEVSPDEA